MKRSRRAISSLWPLGLVFAVLLAASKAEGQTVWTKYAGNPVLERGAPGEWDAGVIDHQETLFDGVTFHMWYAGGVADHEADIGYAYSTDGVTWHKYDYNPVLLRGTPGKWDAGSLQPGAVIWDGALFHMWYGAGAVPGGAGIWYTGYATSPNGVTWTKHPDNPVFQIGDPGDWDSGAGLITAVVVGDGLYHAWYWGQQTLAWISIGYATSPDGVNWTKWPEPVFWPRTPGWDALRVAFPMVAFEGGVYHMWYAGGLGACDGIGHAVSADGIHWARQPLWQPVLPHGEPGTWDAGCIFSSRVVLDGDTAHLWYNAYGNIPAIGYASGPLPFNEAWVFVDDFASGDTSTWSSTVP